MLIKDVGKLTALDRFFYWIKERHAIYLRRKMGKPKPWTDDEVLRSFFFTNPYRENDKVTVWFRENIREPLRNDHRVIFATICFRWFNLPETGLVLIANRQPIMAQSRVINPGGNLLFTWSPEIALERLGKVRDEGGQIFTGAFMINSPPGKPKLEAIIERVTNVWEDREKLVDLFQREKNCIGGGSLARAHKYLRDYPGLGGFMAYEVVTDLRHTAFLEKASDIMTWCNPGPGAIRGMCRILGIPFDASNNSASPPVPKDFLKTAGELLALSKRYLRGMPPLEMREIEHSLCEFDKYERIRLNEGKAKRRYQGV